IQMFVQGRHRYYSLAGAEVARALEALSVLAGGGRAKFMPNTPSSLRQARTCYDHIAGSLGVALHDALIRSQWLEAVGRTEYRVTKAGAAVLTSIGIDVDEARERRRRFAYACLDWSERRPHLAGALGACILETALKRKWVERNLYSRAIDITRTGEHELIR